MKTNREAADRILEALLIAREIEKDDPVGAYLSLTDSMIHLAGQLIPYNENYGHAERIHKLTGGNENGNP